MGTEPSRARVSTGDEAAQTFIKLADVHVKLESKSEAASSWVEASKAYQKAGNPGAQQLAQSEPPWNWSSICLPSTTARFELLCLPAAGVARIPTCELFLSCGR